MSSLIETAARGAAKVLPGALASDTARAQQTERGNQLLSQWTQGGLALGGGVGAAVVLINYLKSLQQEAELADESRLNDDTLYIPAPGHAKTATEVNRWVAPGLAVTSGVLSAGGAYALTQAVYNWLQKKRRQKLLDEAQAEALAAADLETEKTAASARMTFSDLATAFPVAIPLLAALASGGVAYAALNKTFPVVKKPVSKHPRRVRQVADTGEVSELDESSAEREKRASVTRRAHDYERAGYEFLLLTTDALAVAGKSASVASDILNRVAAVGAHAVAHDLREHGLPTLCALVKGASEYPVTPAEKSAAAFAIFNNARLAPTVAAVAAAEWMDMLPSINSYCSQMEGQHLKKLAKLAPLLHFTGNRTLVQEFYKSAATDNPLLQELMALLQPEGDSAGAQPVDSAEEARDRFFTSDMSGSLAEDDEGESEDDTQSEDLSDESQSADDVVDAAFENEFADVG